METLCLNSSETQIAAEILQRGGIVAVPTETVYGLAANAFDIQAIKKIFVAKGRPSDNPLIVHISDKDKIYEVVSSFPEKASHLAEKLWPGPLTMILPKNSKIPNSVTGGLDSVAVRFPAHPVIQEIIKKCGFPLVAPSANLSGSPSPTNFSHVFEDLNGRVDAILDAGECSIGLESTVISFLEDPPRLLRPGAITPKEIETLIGPIIIDDSVYSKLKPEEKVLSPGTKYKHYSPKAKVVIIKGTSEKYAEFLNSLSNENIIALCFNQDIPFLEIPYISYGDSRNSSEQAKKLFSSLREADKFAPRVIYAHCCRNEGVGIAVYNRLVRAAGFDIIKL